MRATDDLSRRCREVLDGNWTGRATKPAPRLYPHQWSWDSAFIAIGNRHHRCDRAALELRTLFAAQWPNGMVPHIVFEHEGRGDYFPSADDWGVPDVVDGVGRSTSGICQPPVHATAVRLVVQAAEAGAGEELARDLVPPLIAWHDHLHARRAIDGALVEVWHPWETGMDNSPAWDGPLARLRFDPHEVPPYRRVDTDHADADARPSDTDYDRYAFLLARLRREGYQPAEPRSLPFRVRDVLFNSVLARAELDLAGLVELGGGDGSERRERSRAVSAAIESELWDERAQWYLSQDAVTGELLPSRIAGGLMPLLTAASDRADRLPALLGTLDAALTVPVGSDAAALLTTARDDAAFDPVRYWRGPSWANITWLAADALRCAGADQRADRLWRGLLHLAGTVGMFEYVDPAGPHGHGSDDFSWTAALTLDVVETLTDG